MIGAPATVRLAACLAAAVALALPCRDARAAEIKVLGFLGLRPILAELAPAFERTTGDRITMDYDIDVAIEKGFFKNAVRRPTLLAPSARTTS
jgi:hypothetical protein